MRLIPTHCSACAHCALTGEDQIREGQARCDECGGSTVVLPSESYTESDVQLFNGIVKMLDEAELDPLRASQLSAEMLAMRFSREGERLRMLVHALPALGLLELVVAQRPESTRVVENIVALLLDAASKKRSQSGYGVAPVLQASSTR
jgi:hypothetical protein